MGFSVDVVDRDVHLMNIQQVNTGAPVQHQHKPDSHEMMICDKWSRSERDNLPGIIVKPAAAEEARHRNRSLAVRARSAPVQSPVGLAIQHPESRSKDPASG